MFLGILEHWTIILAQYICLYHNYLDKEEMVTIYSASLAHSHGEIII